ncbi:hypothetical protein FQZ97_884880 [compost metagenome]
MQFGQSRRIGQATDDGELAVGQGCLDHSMAGLDHLRMPRIAGVAEVRGEVVGTNGEDVHARQRRDGVGVLHAQAALDEHLHRHGVIHQGVHLLHRQAAEPHLHQRGDLRALATGRETAGREVALSLLNGLHPGRDDAQGPAIENPSDDAKVLFRHPHPGRHAQVQGGRAELRGVIQGNPAVFQVHPDRVVAGGPGPAHEIGAPGGTNAESKDGPGGVEALHQVGQGRQAGSGDHGVGVWQ